MYSVSMSKTGKFSQSESREMLAFSMNEEWASEEKEECETEIEMKEVTADNKMTEVTGETKTTEMTGETTMTETTTETKMSTEVTKDDAIEPNIYDNVHLNEKNNENNTKNILSTQISYDSSVEEKEKSRVNYLAHLVIFAFFPCWLFVWCCLSLTNQDYEKFVKKTKEPSKTGK